MQVAVVVVVQTLVVLVLEQVVAAVVVVATQRTQMVYQELQIQAAAVALLREMLAVDLGLVAQVDQE